MDTDPAAQSAVSPQSREPGLPRALIPVVRNKFSPVVPQASIDPANAGSSRPGQPFCGLVSGGG